MVLIRNMDKKCKFKGIEIDDEDTDKEKKEQESRPKKLSWQIPFNYFYDLVFLFSYSVFHFFVRVLSILLCFVRLHVLWKCKKKF